MIRSLHWSTSSRGYASVSVPRDDELQALFGLSAMRLAVSACIAAHQRRLRPDNEYLDVSQAAIRRTLPVLASLPFGLATAALRGAAGLDPSPSGGRVSSLAHATARHVRAGHAVRSARGSSARARPGRCEPIRQR